MHAPPTPFTPTLHDADIENIERATLDAVVPAAVEAFNDWLLPSDPSTIGRATSAVPLRHHHMGPADIARIAAHYVALGSRPAFRVADVPGLGAIHRELERLGYKAHQPTLVQAGSASRMRALFQVLPSRVSNAPYPEWARVYQAEGFDPVDGAQRVRALSRSRNAVYACVLEDDNALAAGTAAFSHGWASIHGMRTVQSSRGRGLAGRVLAGLSQAALDRGLERVFLQVEEGNLGALALYQRCGFVTVWRYHYWRLP